MPDPSPLVTLPRIEAPADAAELATLIDRCLHAEARLTAKHARCYEVGTQAYLAIGKLPPAPRPVNPRTDPHYWARARAGKWLDRGNEALQTAKAVTKKRKALEMRLSVLEARSAVKAWADPFGVAA